MPYISFVDVLLLLIRDDHVLLAQRANTGYVVSRMIPVTAFATDRGTFLVRRWKVIDERGPR